MFPSMTVSELHHNSSNTWILKHPRLYAPADASRLEADRDFVRKLRKLRILFIARSETIDSSLEKLQDATDPQRNELFASRKHLSQDAHQCTILQSSGDSFFVSKLLVYRLVCAVCSFLDPYIYTKSRWECLLKTNSNA
jgi:hypothetical protein